MKSLKEIRQSRMKAKANIMFFSKVRDLSKRKLDTDVFLPSLNMNLQRDLVWSLDQKRELIMSVLLERNILPLCIYSTVDHNDHKGNDITQIIDGKQRVTTLLKFYEGEFSIVLEGKEYFFNELPEDYQMEIAHYNVMAYIAYDEFSTPIMDQDKIDWFKQINFAGTPMDMEHMEKLK